MNKVGYPRVDINLEKLRHNAKKVNERCLDSGITMTGVIKGASGLPLVAKQYLEGGVKIIGTSRLDQVSDCKKFGIDTTYMLIRIPMLSEVRSVVELTDISLNSEVEVLKALNNEARIQDKQHKVIIMTDLGDLREGFWDKEELVETAVWVDEKLRNLTLAGIGTNVGCYGSILPTTDKLNELIELAEKIEERTGRELEFISGGATSSLMRIWDGDMPKRINHLRLGEGVLLARDLDVIYGYDMSMLHNDAFKIKAEVVEVKKKPSHPVGKVGVDAFGHRPNYVDRGMRDRMLLGIGRVDYGDPGELLPVDEGIEIMGASSDHTIVDIEDASRDFKVGDIVEFDVCYATIVYITSSNNVKINYV